MMEQGRTDVTRLASALLEVFPELDDEKRRVALATYRVLARGLPASFEEIADEAGAEVGEVHRTLDDWIGVYRDDQDRVIGFWGLAIPRMRHRIEVDEVGLHAWCAWDTLFLPELLRKTARVESTCEATGEEVRLTVSPSGIELAQPASSFLSFLEPEASTFREDVVRNFCHYVHFFRSQEAGADWIERNPGTFLLTLEEAVELARLKNRAQFGEILYADLPDGANPKR